MEDQIINRVSQSSLVSIDLANFIPQGERAFIDLKDFLYQGLILREKEFRAALKEIDWEVYRNKYVAVGCSTDAIIPTWAYMLFVTQLLPVSKAAVKGTYDDLEKSIFLAELNRIGWQTFENTKVVIKGCSELVDPAFCFFEVTKKLMPWVSSIMYGEPCSTVPVFKKSVKNFPQ